MIDLYTWTTPNGRKPAIMLEECGLEYSVHPINIRNGDQFKPEFVKICPNSKIPAIVDHDAGVSIFESGAILVHLAEKTGKFLPAKDPGRAKVLEWLFWQMANVGPMFGQAGHFVNAAPEKIHYAIDRYATESARLIKVLDNQLANTEYMAGAYLDRRHRDLPVARGWFPRDQSREARRGGRERQRRAMDYRGRRPSRREEGHGSAEGVAQGKIHLTAHASMR